MTMENIYLFYALLLLLAFLYAAVGHGGASGYLALMAIYSMPPATMKPTALFLNIIVSGIAFFQFYQGGHFLRRLFFPLAIASVPMAFLGGLVSIEANVYKKILGCLLLLPIARFLFMGNTDNAYKNEPKLLVSVVIGAAIGFLSGLIGIGGGIILSPLLLLLRWTDQKQAAATSAAFIFVNSVSGLAGQLSVGVRFTNDMFIYIVVAAVGGMAGSYLGARRFAQPLLKNILALVLVVAAYKLLLTNA